MVDVAANVTAEQVVEWSAYGHLLGKDGNRGPAAAPQGVYACAGTEQWVALAVADDAQWDRLRAAMGTPAWADDDALSTAAGRRAAHDELDRRLGEWFAPQDRDQVVAALLGRGVPAAPVVPAHLVDEDPQLAARRFYAEVAHPDVGAHRFPGWPVRFSGGPDGWPLRPAPRLGEHNDDVLRGVLGLDDSTLQALRAENIIGDRPRPRG